MVWVGEAKCFEGHAEHGNEHGTSADFVDINHNFSGGAFHKDVVREDREKEEAGDLDAAKDEPESGAGLFKGKIITEHDNDDNNIEGSKEDGSPEVEADIAGDSEGEVAGVTLANPVVAENNNLRERKN